MMLSLDIFKPEFNKKVNLEIIEKMEPMDWANLEVNDNVNRVIKELLIDHNGLIYQGEWDAQLDEKDGRGVQIWPDGTRYDGQWRRG